MSIPVRYIAIRVAVCPMVSRLHLGHSRIGTTLCGSFSAEIQPWGLPCGQVLTQELRMVFNQLGSHHGNLDRVEGKKKKMKLHCGWERWGRCWIPLVRNIFPYSITTQAASGRSGARTSALKVKAPGQSPEFKFLPALPIVTECDT